MRTYIHIFALLCGTAFLLFASGLHALLLPLRGNAEEFSVGALGLIGTSWAAGFVFGCVMAPLLVRRVGHVRAFGFFAATAAIVALSTGLFINALFWIIVRALTGFAMAGAFMVIESWLNEKATNETRGKIFGIYMMIQYGAVVLGQMTVGYGNIFTTTLFIVTGIFFCLALIPTAISTASSPRPLTQAKLDLRLLWRNSPIAVVSCVLIGITTGTWNTLGAVYGAQSGMSNGEVALMVSITLAAGALMQLPIGKLSDIYDRRLVMAGSAATTAFIALIIFIVSPQNTVFILVITALYGLSAYTIYPVAVAHANDSASDGSFVEISSGLLLLYGFGTIIGPLLAAPAMEFIHPSALFGVIALANIAIVIYAMIRIKARAAPSDEDKDSFKAISLQKTPTPETLRLDPRADET